MPRTSTSRCWPADRRVPRRAQVALAVLSESRVPAMRLRGAARCSSTSCGTACPGRCASRCTGATLSMATSWFQPWRPDRACRWGGGLHDAAHRRGIRRRHAARRLDSGRAQARRRLERGVQRRHPGAVRRHARADAYDRRVEDALEGSRPARRAGGVHRLHEPRLVPVQQPRRPLHGHGLYTRPIWAASCTSRPGPAAASAAPRSTSTSSCSWWTSAPTDAGALAGVSGLRAWAEDSSAGGRAKPATLAAMNAPPDPAVLSQAALLSTWCPRCRPCFLRTRCCGKRRPPGPTSAQPDRLHHRRQRRRELGRRALPEVRPDAAQRAEGARLHRRRASRWNSAATRSTRPGYDLLSAVIGSEGMLAVTTEVTVKLVPKPQLARCIMASFDDVRKAGDAVAAVIAAGIIPAGLEMMDKPMTAAVEDFVHAGYDLTAEAILLCESDGTPEEVEEEIGRMSEVLRAAGATAIAVSRDEAERLQLLERPQERVPRLGPHQPRLHVHGLDDPAQAAGRHPAGDPGDGEEVRPALRQRVPCRRRQPAPADPVRRQRCRPAAPLRTVRRRHPGDQCRDGRHRHRRARRGRGEAQLDVRAVQRRRAASRCSASSAPSTPRACSTRAR